VSRANYVFDDRDVETVDAFEKLEEIKAWVETGNALKSFSYSPANPSQNNHLLMQAAMQGQSDIAKWLVNDLGVTIEPVEMEDTILKGGLNAVDAAALRGHYEQAKWLMTAATLNLPSKNLRYTLTNATFCNLEYFQWLYNDIASRIEVDVNAVFSAAATKGSEENTKWLFNEFNQSIDITANDNEVVKLVAFEPDDGDIDAISTLKWLIENTGQIVDCRSCETWYDDDLELSFRDFAKEVKEYLISVKNEQESLGIDVWAAGIKNNIMRAAKRAANQQRRGSW